MVYEDTLKKMQDGPTLVYPHRGVAGKYGKVVKVRVESFDLDHLILTCKTKYTATAPDCFSKVLPRNRCVEM